MGITKIQGVVIIPIKEVIEVKAISSPNIKRIRTISQQHLEVEVLFSREIKKLLFMLEISIAK